MFKKPAIIFDLDDTLIYTHEVYLAITAEFLEKMAEYGLTDDNLYGTLDAYDQENVEAAGAYRQEAFPQAMLQTYEFYCQKLQHEYQQAEADEILNIGWQINQRKYQPVEGAAELLENLTETHRLFLLTQGEEEMQMKKIKESGLFSYFEQCIVVPKKSTAIYQTLIQQYQLSFANTWIIGNSIKSEIKPALELGLPCILVQVTPGWDYESTTLSNGVTYPIVRKLLDCLSLIEVKKEVKSG